MTPASVVLQCLQNEVVVGQVAKVCKQTDINNSSIINLVNIPITWCAARCISCTSVPIKIVGVYDFEYMLVEFHLTYRLSIEIKLYVEVAMFQKYKFFWR